MKLNSSMKFLIAMAAAAVLATSVKASQVPQYNQGDLLLGFYDTTGTVTNDYLLDLGPVANDNFSSNFTLVTGLGTDLTTVFGSNWFTSGNIDYGFASSNTNGGFQVFASDPAGNSPWLRQSVQSSAAQAVFNVGSQYSLASQTHGETNPDGLLQADGATNSWDSAASSGLDGNYFGAGGDGFISDVVSNGIYFDEINEGSGNSTVLGSFAINSNGDVNFTAVPEPSTFAALGLGAAVLAFARRRRSMARA